MYPSYLDLGAAEIRRRAEHAVSGLRDCVVCPRDCHVDRTLDRPERGEKRGKQPVCRTWRNAWVASHFPHHGEEDCLRGWAGSGTIFFSWCNLRCVFCQNWDLSQDGAGKEVGPQQLAGMMLELQARGCHNINWVTPEHVVPQILEGLAIAVDKGLRLPLVYNTSAYDSLHSLQAMEGIIDIYMPDFKFWHADHAKRYAAAPDYPQVAQRAIREMHRQVGVLQLDPTTGLAVRGMLVRHLVMPDGKADTREIMRFLATEISPDTYVNVMGQYRPEHRAGKFPEIARRPSAGEMHAAFAAARDEGILRLDQRAPRRWASP